MLSNTSQVFKEYPAHLVNIQVSLYPQACSSAQWGQHSMASKKSSCWFTCSSEKPITNLSQTHNSIMGSTQLDAGGTPKPVQDFPALHWGV